MTLRLPRPLNPFVRRKPKVLTAHEAWSVAEAERQRWAEAEFSTLCCVYAGALEGEDPAIGPLTLDGRSRLWHFDSYAADAERFLRVQVFDGRARSEVTRIRAGGLNYPQMKFPFAQYGYREDRGGEAAPVALPPGWAESSRIMASARATLSPPEIERLENDQGFLALVTPAVHVTKPETFEWTETAQPGAAGPEIQTALILRGPDPERKLNLLRFNPITGEHIGG